MTADELIEEFELFDDWEERYRYIIETGNSMPPLEIEYQSEQHRVQGCLSSVWLVIEQTANGNYYYRGDSDSQLVKGLVCIVIMLYSDKSAEEILQLDINHVFEAIDLRQHISRSRSNGLNSMIGRIKSLALETLHS
ncbi:MAG: cysteine desulfuration protein SufE [Planctomycetaceae bacterium]|nr:cysteine desulfuration protein SufE [Planctomycetaceae bacterium]